MTSAAAGQFLPAADDRIDIERIELQPAAAPAGALGGDHRRAAAEEGVEHDVGSGRTVENRIGYQRHRLHRRVQPRQVALRRAAAKGIASRVPPDIAAVTPKATELDVVAMLMAALFEDKD